MHLDDDRHREAWRRKYRLEPSPWRGPADLAPLIDAVETDAIRTGRVLEIGASGGKSFASLPREWNAIALDWVGESLPATPHRVIADARALPFRPESLDLVLLVFVLGHLDAAGRQRASEEAIRVLAPGGGILVRAFAPGDLRAETGTFLAPLEREREGLRHAVIPAEALRALFSPLRSALLEERTVPTRFGGPRRLVEGVFLKPRS